MDHRLLAASFDHGLTLLLAVGISIGITGWGLVGLRLLKIRPAAWARLALGFLLGLALIGMLHFGLALNGLFFPRMLFVGPATGLFLPVMWQVTRKAWRQGILKPPSRWWWFGLLPAIAPLKVLLLPDTNGDALWVHLAIPWQTLQAHKFTVEGTSVVLHYPLLAEMVYGIAVAAGRDAMTHVFNAMAFGSAVILVAGWCAVEAGPMAGWLAAALAGTFGMAGSLAIVAKNDCVAAAFVVAGALLVSGGGITPGMILLGCAAATKFNGMVLLAVAVGLLWMRRGRRPGPLHLLLAVLPLLPWLAKNWLMTGDPVYPQFSRWLPNALWDPESTVNLGLLTGPWDWHLRLRDFPIQLIRGMLDTQPALACGLPLVGLALSSTRSPVRWVGWFSILATFILWIALPLPAMRYALGPWVMLAGCVAIIVARSAAEWSPRVRRLGMAGLLISGWLPVGPLLAYGIEPGPAVMYLTGRISEQEYLAGRLTTYWDASTMLERHPDARRFLPMGTIYSYHLPGRMMAERTFSRTWGWALARESATAGEIRKRVRQTGCRYVLYNFTGDAAPNPDAAAFPWDARMISIWREFVGRDLDLIEKPGSLDPRLGGFCFYEIRRLPLTQSPTNLPYLPGLRSAYETVTRHATDADGAAFLREALALQRLAPHVDSVTLLVAQGYRRIRQWTRAYAVYLGPAQRGVVSLDSLPGLAESAAFLGREQEALAWWRKACQLMPASAGVATKIPEALREIAQRKRTEPVVK